MNKKIIAVITASAVIAAGNISILPEARTGNYVISASAAVNLASGECGDENSKLSWIINEEGTLTISGQGAMKNWYEDESPWYSYISEIKEIIIKDGVTNIGNCAFYKLTNLTSVSIPESVTSIGYESFFRCENLSSVTIPDKVTSIGDSAFYGCVGLTSIKIPYGVTSIGSYAFAFCESLASISIPTSVKSIGKNALHNTKWLDTNKEQNPIVISNDFLIDGKNCEGDVIIPDGVRCIEENAFEKCSGITSVTIPESVTSIDDDAFAECTGLTSIELPSGVKNIGARAFYQCTNLSSLILPKNVESVGFYAFSNTKWYNEKKKESPLVIEKDILIDAENCKGDIEIPEGVRTIADGAFSGYMLFLDSITIPESVVRIGKEAIQYNNIKNISYSGTKIQWNKINIASGNDGLLNADIQFKIDIIDSGECGTEGSAVKWTFDTNGCLTISGDGVMDENAYTQWESYIEDIINVVIDSGVTGLGEYRFNDCENLTSISVNEDNTTYSSEDGVLFNKDKTELIRFPYKNKTDNYVIPDSITTIAKGAFYYCELLASVTIPDKLTTIEDEAFHGCKNLKTAVLPDSVTVIGNKAFYSCSSLTGITIPENITVLGESSFSYCKSLTSITIPDNITSIENNTFQSCSSLKNITLPESITSIGENTFRDCKSLTAVTIPDKVTSIEDGTFRGCESLTAITIPDSVTEIGENAFAYCIRLSSITIPDDVVRIEKNTFNGCSYLSSVTIPESITDIGYSAFNECRILSDIYYTGTEEEWNAITIGLYNKPVNNATIHFNYEKPEDNMDYLPGDANCDGKILLNDAVLILQYLGNPDEYKLTETGILAADVSNTGDGITNKDALAIQSFLLGTDFI